jgi:hypothetical protein
MCVVFFFLSSAPTVDLRFDFGRFSLRVSESIFAAAGLALTVPARFPVQISPPQSSFRVPTGGVPFPLSSAHKN